jgi:hypothetical protein
MLLFTLFSSHVTQSVALPAEQVPQDPWHAVQVPLSSYMPAAHDEVHVPAPDEKEEPVLQLRQFVDRPPEHVAQLASQERQEPLLSYLPLGQLETHDPSSKRFVPELGHVRHEKELLPLQVSHEVWQARQLAWSLITLTKVPLAHSAMQVPLERKFSEPVELQERQSSASGPEQVPHEAAHGAQCDDEFAYFPTGVQSSRQR